MNQVTAKIKTMYGTELFLQQKKEIQKLINENKDLKNEVIQGLEKLIEIQDDYIELLEEYNSKVSPSSILKIVRD